MSPLLISFGYPTQTTLQWNSLQTSQDMERKWTLTTQKSSVRIADMKSPDGNISSMWWNNITGDEHKKRDYFRNKRGCISAFKHSLIATQSLRLNEHSPCKVFGMLQNKHRVSGSVSTFGCHLIHIHPPCTQAKLEFTPRHSDHLSPSILAKNILTPPGTDHKALRQKGLC